MWLTKKILVPCDFADCRERGLRRRSGARSIIPGSAGSPARLSIPARIYTGMSAMTVPEYDQLVEKSARTSLGDEVARLQGKGVVLETLFARGVAWEEIIEDCQTTRCGADCDGHPWAARPSAGHHGQRCREGGPTVASSGLDHPWRQHPADTEQRGRGGRMTKEETNGRCRIVLTGGPGEERRPPSISFAERSAKAWSSFLKLRRCFFEAVFRGRTKSMHASRRRQPSFMCSGTSKTCSPRSIPSGYLLCDRGTIDGAAYWPGGASEFFDFVGSTLANELERYDAVLFFETAAAGGMSIEGGNPARIESNEQAIDLDHRLRELWLQHPRAVVVPHHTSFVTKIMLGLVALERMVAELSSPQP